MTDDKMLDRVRKLLAKAEKAGSEHEAEAFTAKAQELILKYAIDEAMLQQSGEKPGERIIAHTVTVKGYARAKLSLMHRVARGLGMRSVQYSNDRAGWSEGKGQVVGWESDVAAFEVLFASLQMQATTEAKREFARLKNNWPALRAARDEWVGLASIHDTEWWREHSEVGTDSYIPRRAWRDQFLAEHPEPEDPGRVMPHGRAFMQSFLIGYADVIGRRLMSQRTTAVKDAEQERPGAAVAVRDRGQAVEQFADRQWGKLSSAGSTRSSSNAGYYSGRAAGARANIGNRTVGGGHKAIGGR